MKGIKKIIFDVDNTLIFWKKEYISALINTVEKYNIKVDPRKIDAIVETLEKKFVILSKESFLKTINEELNLNLDMDFINYFFEEQKSLAVVDNELIELLEYLSSKYELIIFTNYFHEIQEGRLKTAQIDKFFSKIYGGDDVPVKPNAEGFNIIIGNDNKDEYVMIGDSIEIDIMGAKNAGIKSILFDYKNVINNSEYMVIKDLKELKNIF